MIALCFDVGIDDLIVEKLCSLRLAGNTPVVIIQQAAEKRELPLPIQDLDLHEIRKLPSECLHVDKVPVSDLCEELGLRPTVFYRWQKELFENGAAAFQPQERPHRQVEEKQKRIEFLEKKVRTKDEVLAELMAEHIALKKSLGEL
jgi:transposase-like protein